MTTASLHSQNRRVGLIALGAAGAMLGLGFASAPLYRLFCQITGFEGTTQRASEAQAAAMGVASTTMSIRFDANTSAGMPWKFRALQATDTVSLGARDMAIFTARNMSGEPITGTATFNVQPDVAGKYFNKIQCFCFTQQTLQPGEEMRMPVVYYVDPKILDDEDAKGVEQITLSYTFHPVRADLIKPEAVAPAAVKPLAVKSLPVKALDRAKAAG